MKVFIIEDELMAQSNLIRALERNFPDTEIVGREQSVAGAVQWLRKPENRPDVIFMDVELQDGDCFEIFRQVNIQAKVIMTTAYDQYAIKAFEAGSIDYLLKPIDAQALNRAVARCRMSGGYIDINNLLKLFGKAAEEYKERFIIRFNDRIFPVRTNDIAYFYSEEKNNYIVTFSKERYIIDETLDEIIDELNPKKFFKISRSCIISIEAISSIIKQPGGRLKIVPLPDCSFDMTVSRSKSEEFLTWIE